MSAPTSEVLFTTTPTISKGWYDRREAGVIRVLVSLSAAITGTIPIQLPANALLRNAKICASVAGTHATATGRVGVFLNATVSAANQVALGAAAVGGVISKNDQNSIYTFGATAAAPSTSAQTLSIMSTDNAGTAAGGNVTGTFAVEIHYETFPLITNFV